MVISCPLSIGFFKDTLKDLDIEEEKATHSSEIEGMIERIICV